MLKYFKNPKKIETENFVLEFVSREFHSSSYILFHLYTEVCVIYEKIEKGNLYS
jgi:hypothetical protein